MPTETTNKYLQTNMEQTNFRRYRFMATLTVVSVIFLILVGGLVRSAGAGMGCPDWPKCFGLWVPPTDVRQLPSDYQQIYAQSYANTEFNVFKTWTEYLNRLVGVLIGFFILLTFAFSISLRRLNRSIFWLSLASLVLVLVQGWLGGKVVKSNLHTGMITIHMVLALLILVLLITATLIAYSYKKKEAKAVFVTNFEAKNKWIALWITLLIFTQIVMGTQVREQVDVISKQLGEGQRDAWVAALTGIYEVHKYFYYVITFFILGWYVWLRDYFLNSPILKTWYVILVGTLFSEVAFGISMHRFAIPPALQPLHLLFAVLLFSVSYVLTVLLFRQEKLSTF